MPLGLPQLLVHGHDDDSVPLSISETYHATTVRAGDAATLLRLPATGHFELIDPSARVWPTIVAALLPVALTPPGDEKQQTEPYGPV